MSYQTIRRRRQIAAKGRLMQIVRPNKSASVSIVAYAPPPQASQLVDGVSKAPFVAQITADEVSAASFRPDAKDKLVDGSKTYTLTDASPVYDGTTICGWTLIAAGGQ